MKKAMIVQPMNGLGEEQILEARAKAVAELERADTRSWTRTSRTASRCRPRW